MLAAEAAPVFAALGDRTRLSLVIRLSDGGTASIVELATDTHLTRQAVTKHLHVLEEAGLVVHARDGRQTRYRMRGERLADVSVLLDDVTAQWDAALGRLRSLVEG